MKYLVKIEENKEYNGIIEFSKLKKENFYDFDYYRIVNPLTKEVFSYDNKILKKIPNYNCFDLWGNGKCCQYCVSTNSLLSNSIKKKLEQIGGTLFLAKVLPVSIDNKNYVLELFQNIGDSYVKTVNEQVKLSQIVSNLNSMASLDSFSGLYSHGFMYEKLMNISRENTLPVCLICMDIDNMKYVNDYYGHYAGDELIQKVSMELVKANGNNIFSGRTGGDEFQIIFINYNENEALEKVKDILKKAERILINNEYYATVSWAIGERKSNQTAKDFMDSVDSKMYEVKSQNHLL